MKIGFVVTDEEGSISWDSKMNSPQLFQTFAAAKKRSVELAECAPGQPIRIFKMVAVTKAAISKPETAEVKE